MGDQFSSWSVVQVFSFQQVLQRVNSGQVQVQKGKWTHLQPLYSLHLVHVIVLFPWLTDACTFTCVHDLQWTDNISYCDFCVIRSLICRSLITSIERNSYSIWIPSYRWWWAYICLLIDVLMMNDWMIQTNWRCKHTFCSYCQYLHYIYSFFFRRPILFIFGGGAHSRPLTFANNFYSLDSY